MEELKDQVKAMEEELKHAQEDRNKAAAISQKFHDFIEHPGDISSTKLDYTTKAQAN